MGLLYCLYIDNYYQAVHLFSDSLYGRPAPGGCYIVSTKATITRPSSAVFQDSQMTVLSAKPSSFRAVDCVSGYQIAGKFCAWQEAGYVHPLTCGNDSGHPVLVLSDTRPDGITAQCSECGYEQIITNDSNLGQLLLGFPGIPPAAS